MLADTPAGGPSGSSDIACDPVTTLVGICEPDFVIIAADSRTTRLVAGTSVPTDTRTKVYVLGNWLVGFAGDDELVDEWREHLSGSPSSRAGEVYGALMGVETIRQGLGAQRRCPGSHIRASAFVACQDPGGCALLVVCDADDEAVSCRSLTRAVNSPAGQRLVPLEVLLRERPTPGSALAAAATLVMQAATIDPSTGGAVQAGVLDTSGARLVPGPDVQRIVQTISEGWARTMATGAKVAAAVAGLGGTVSR